MLAAWRAVPAARPCHLCSASGQRLWASGSVWAWPWAPGSGSRGFVLVFAPAEPSAGARPRHTALHPCVRVHTQHTRMFLARKMCLFPLPSALPNPVWFLSSLGRRKEVQVCGQGCLILFFPRNVYCSSEISAEHQGSASGVQQGLGSVPSCTYYRKDQLLPVYSRSCHTATNYFIMKKHQTTA